MKFIFPVWPICHILPGDICSLWSDEKNFAADDGMRLSLVRAPLAIPYWVSGVWGLGCPLSIKYFSESEAETYPHARSLSPLARCRQQEWMGTSVRTSSLHCLGGVSQTKLMDRHWCFQSASLVSPLPPAQTNIGRHSETRKKKQLILKIC